MFLHLHHALIFLSSVCDSLTQPVIFGAIYFSLIVGASLSVFFCISFYSTYEYIKINF